MRLVDTKIGEYVEIDALNVNEDVRQRFISMGLIRDAHICVKQYGLFKSTVQVKVNSTLIGLRRDEASCIEVHKVVA